MVRDFALVMCTALVMGCGGEDPDSKTGDSVSGPATDGAVASSDGTHSQGSDSSAPPPPPTCDSDWILGSTFYKCSDCQMGETCDPMGAPQNCLDGHFVKWNDGDCRCIVECSSFASQPGPGEVCSKDGTWHCRQITNFSGSKGLMCVPDSWDVCVEGGNPASPPPPPPADSGVNCKQSDEPCSSDGECCSGTCFDVCL